MGGEYKNTSVVELGYNDFKVNGGSININNSNFKNKLGLVKFYAPWCPHCTNMVESMSFLSDQLKDHGFTVAAVNCDDTTRKNDKLAQAIGLEGFPSLYFVNGRGELKDYQGGRELPDLLKEVVKLSKQEA